jgi:hypothetical protein
MAYDENLAERIRDHLAPQPNLTEKKMFGGIAFMIAGNMALGVSKNSLMLRVGPDNYESALDEPGVDEFGPTPARPMRGWVLVSPKKLASADDFARWVDKGVDFASSLPAK